jgi:hypothetical protein
LTTYIALFSLTEAGIKAAKDSARRLDVAKKLLADMGGEMKQFYMVMGESTSLESARLRTTPSWRVTSCSSAASASYARRH